jgi:hypothetical protein
MQEEIWKDIPGYEGKYQVSNLGRVKSLPRKMCNNKGCHISKEKILKPIMDHYKYYNVKLYINNKQSTKKIHQLVSIAFLNHIPCGYKLVVDHINNIKTDNRVENLQIITSRENSSKDKNGNSKYIGVCWDKRNNKWRSTIRINRKAFNLGSFDCELEASEAYQNKLKEINKIVINK